MISVARGTAPRGARIGRARASPGRIGTAPAVSSTSAPRSRVAVVRAARVGTGRSSSSTSSGATDASGVSRRAALAGKRYSPSARRSSSRGPPRAPPGRNLCHRGPRALLPRVLSSILYTETDPDAKASAKAASPGRGAPGGGKVRGGRRKFEEVYALAPTEYKMCQRAGLRTASCKAMSACVYQNTRKPTTPSRSCVWGGARGGRGGTSWRTCPPGTSVETREDPVGAFTATEGLAVLVPIWPDFCTLSPRSHPRLPILSVN